jgi:hypothetical protein
MSGSVNFLRGLSAVLGVGCLGSGTLTFASWHIAYELEQTNKRLKHSLDEKNLDIITLHQTIASERSKFKYELGNARSTSTQMSILAVCGVGVGYLVKSMC